MGNGRNPNQSLAQLAVEHIHSRLLSGELRPGSRLSDLSLSHEIGISRTPVREAINQMASGGLVEQIPGVGAFIKIPDDAEILELLQVREYIESLLISLVAPDITDAALHQMRSICSEAITMIRQIRRRRPAEPEPQDLERNVALDAKFHEVLLAQSKNRFIARIMKDLQLMVRIFAYKQEHEPGERLRRMVRTWREHMQILRALTRRDSEGAAAMMIQHIRNYPRVTYGHIRYRPGSGLEIAPEHLALLRRQKELSERR